MSKSNIAVCSQLDPCQSEATTWTSKELHLIDAGTKMGMIWSVSIGSAIIIRSSLIALHDYSQIIVIPARVFKWLSTILRMCKMTNTHRWGMQLISALNVCCTDLTKVAPSD